MSFSKDEIPDDLINKVPEGSEIRCLHWNERKKGVCNKLLCRGEVPETPLEFKCPNCGKISVFKKI